MILLDLTHVSVAERIAEEERLRAEEEAAIAQAEAAKCEAEARQQPRTNKGKKNEPPQLKQRVSKCNVRRKPKSDENSGRRMNVLLPGTQRLLELQMERRRRLGDVPHPQILLHQHPLVRKPLHPPDRKVQRLLSTDQGQLEEAELGGTEKQRKLLVVLLPLCPFALPRLL